MIGGGYFQFGGIRFLYLLSDESGEDEDDGPAEAVAAEVQRKKHDDSQRQHLAQVV